MEEGPKSFWSDRERVDTSQQWVTHYDSKPVLAQEAEIIHAMSYRNLPLPIAEDMELWEIASYLGLHRIETLEDHEKREIVEAKQEYWNETASERMERLADYSARRKARARERKRKTS